MECKGFKKYRKSKDNNSNGNCRDKLKIKKTLHTFKKKQPTTDFYKCYFFSELFSQSACFLQSN